MSKTPDEIVYEEAVRAIQLQPTALDELRSRTSILLAAAGVIGGVLGKAASDHGGIGAAGYLALVVLAIIAGLAIAVLLPRWGEWRFALSPAILFEHYVDEATSPRQLYRELANWLEMGYDKNDARLKKLYEFFWWACVALAVDVGLWLLEIAI